MKKTWKSVLGTLAVSAALGGSSVQFGAAWGDQLSAAAPAENAPGVPVTETDEAGDDGVVRFGGAASSGAPSGEGAVRLGGAPAGSGVDQASGSYLQGPEVPATIQPAGVVVPAPYTSNHYEPGTSVGYAISNEPEDVLFRVGRDSHQIYGVDHGFTNLQAFLALETETDLALWFANPRLILTDEGRGAMNLGFGHRAYIPDLDRVFSVSTWWDFDTGHNGDYHQLGASIAMIGRNMSLRANGNWVVSRDETFIGSVPIGAPRLEGGMLVQDVRRFTEVAYNQADLEISTPLPAIGQYGLEWGAGPYFLFGADGPDAVGAKARVETQITEDLWVNAIITNDKVFDTNVSINFELTIPGAPPAQYFRRNKVVDYLRMSDRRQYRVATDVVDRVATEIMRGMTGGGDGGVVQPLMLAIVDPNVTDDPALAFGGDGSEANPFRSLLDYTEEAADVRDDFAIVFVRRRAEGDSTNLDTTISLLDGQALLGEGVEHTLTNLGVGAITLPGATTGPRPVLSNASAPGQNVVTLANANQVSGFVIDAGGDALGLGRASGIVGDNIDGFSISNVEMRNVVDGIRIVSDTLGTVGTNRGIITDNLITGIGLGSSNGISVDHRAGTLALLVKNNNVSMFQGEDANRNGTLDLSEDVNMNGALDPGEDLDFDATLDLSEDLNGNMLLDQGFGIRIAASGTSRINANDFQGDPGLGILGNMLSADGTGVSVSALDSSLIVLDYQNNVATGSTDLIGAGHSFLADGGRINIFTMTGNMATGGSGNGGAIQTRNSGRITVSNPRVDPMTGAGFLAFDNNQFNSNSLDGLFVEADSGSILFDQIINSQFNGNGDDGLDLGTTNGGSLIVTDEIIGNAFSSNGDNGVELTGGIGGMLSVDLGDPTAPNANMITGNGGVTGTGSGVFLSTVGGTINSSLRGVTSSNNVGNGATIFLDGGTLILDGIEANVFNGNGLNGLSIVNNNGGRLITPFVADNNFDNNQLAGMFIGGTGPIPGVGVATTGLVDLGSVTRNSFNRDVTGTEGIRIEASDMLITGTLTLNSFVGRTPVIDPVTGAVTDPGAGRGIGGVVGGTSVSPTNGGLDLAIGSVVATERNTFMNNGDAHVGLEMVGNTVNNLEFRNSDFNAAFDVASTQDYTGEGVHLVLRDTAILTGFARDSTFSNNAGDGFQLEIAGNNDAGNDTTPAARVDDFVFEDNSFLANGSNGLNVRRTGRGQFNRMIIRDNIFDGNGTNGPADAFDGNNIPGIGSATANGINGLLIASIGANQLNLPNMMPDSVSIFDNEFTNNAADGVEFFIGADADILAFMDSNLIDSNGLNGIQVAKQIDDAKDSRSLTGVWTRNTITNNGDDGIELEGLLGNVLNDPIAGSMVPVPGAGTFRQYGLVIGDIAVNPIGVRSSLGNVISDNAADGIDVKAGGTVTIGNNLITRNGTLTVINGLATADSLGLNPRVIHAGINIDGPEYEDGTIVITGTTDVTVDDFIKDRVSFQEVLAFSNHITDNRGDGVEFLVEGGAPWFDFQAFTGDPAGFPAIPFDPLDTQFLSLVNNEITQNDGRGVDILVRPGDTDPFDSDNLDPDGVPQAIGNSTLATVSMIGNHIKENLLEGVYIVTTNDEDTNQIQLSQAAPGDNDGGVPDDASDDPDGSIIPTVRLNIEMHANQIITNGFAVPDFPATGLVVRVGTSDGGFGFTFPGGFATNGFNPEDTNNDGILDNDLDGDGFLDSLEPSFGGIAMSATFNLFDGNLGDDILFHSFTSTVDPPTTQGVWDAMQFTPMGFFSDPLSRLDLNFTGNRFNSVEANNEDATVGTFNEPGAYYDDVDNVFKRRLGTATPGGPFGAADVRRNAQRLASRWITGPFVLPPDPLISPDLGLFLYPGMGNSTFRVRGGENFFTDQGLTVADAVSPVTIPEIFILDQNQLAGDTQLTDAFGEARGAFFTGVNFFGEQPFGWGILENIPSLPPF